MSYPYNHVVLRHVFNKETYFRLRDLAQSTRQAKEILSRRTAFLSLASIPTVSELQEAECTILISKSS